MAAIDISDDHLIIQLRGTDNLFAMRPSVAIPLEHVAAVQTGRGGGALLDRSRKPASVESGLFSRTTGSVASVVMRDGVPFFEVSNPDLALVIDLRNEEYRRIVVELDDETPELAQERIVRALERLDEVRLPWADLQPDRYA